MFDGRFTRLAGLLLFSLAAAACGDTTKDSKPPVPPAPPATPAIVSFVAAPEEIVAGESASLHWVTKNAVDLEIRDGNGNEVATEGADLVRGSVQVQPTATTAYTLAVTGADDSQGRAVRTVTVTVTTPAVDAPTIESFTASPAEVAMGGTATLSWRTSNATMISIQDDAGAEVELGDAEPGEGQVTVEPTRSPTAYYLVVAGPGGRATASATVEVSGHPRISKFFVDPIAPVRPGGTVALVWETTNATELVIRKGTTTVLETAQASGRHEVVLPESATFELEARGAGGTTNAFAEARVGAAILAFSASERVVRAGDPIVLSWEIEDADHAVLDGPGGYHLAIPDGDVARGEVTVNVAASGEFVLQAIRRDVSVPAKLAVQVTEAPRIREFTAAPGVVTAAHERPATVTLSWRQDGADRCTLLANNSLVPGFADFACATNGSAEVEVRGVTNFRLVAKNAAGEHARTASVQAVAPAEIVAFAKHPDRRVAPGTTIELSWEVAEADGVELTKNGLPLPIDPTAFTGTYTDTLGVDAVYELIARNSLGDPTVATLNATTGVPVILEAHAEPAFVGIGDAFEIHWTADGGDVLVIRGPTDEEEFRTTDTALIDRGSATVLAPLGAAEYTYSVVASNGAGDGVPFEVTVTVSDGPMIESFTIEPAAISLGQSATLSWRVRNDPDGQRPTLTLVDNFGTNYPLTGKNPNNDSLTVTPAEQGIYTFTLTATTPDRTPATARVSLDASVPPEIVTFTASATEVSTEGGTVAPDVVLTWESRNTVELTLWVKGADGNLVPPPFHRVSLALGATQEQVDAGSYTVHPTESTTYVARARNRIGTDVFAEVRVVVDPPEILDFRAVPGEVQEGGTTTLQWTTSNATAVKILPQPVVRSSDNFVDISAAAGAGTVTFSSSTAVATITFPTGFTYPFQGVDRTEIQVCTEGWAGFNTANTATNTVGYAFPTSSTYDEVNFAPYWDSHDHTLNAAAGLYYGLASDAEGDFFVIQWKNWSFSTTADNPSNLNFEIILRPNGDFEYRYGTMTSAVANRASGYDVSIGYQGTTSSQPHGQLVPFPAGLPAGGLQNQSFRVIVSPPLSGTQVANPESTTTYTLLARNDDTEVAAETRVIVWKNPVFTFVRTDPAPPMANRPFDIIWDVKDATRIRVFDPSGTEICNVVDPAAVLAGSCSATAPGPGVTNFTLIAENGPLNAPVASTTRPLQTMVLPYLGIDSLVVTPQFPAAPGDTVTIEWQTTGAIEMTLWACPTNSSTCTDITPHPANPAAGSTTHVVQTSTRFRLEVGDMLGRTAEASAGAFFNPAYIDSFTASATQIAAGQEVTLTWHSAGATGGTLDPPPPLVEEVTGSAPFIDISATGTLVSPDGTEDASRYTVNFPGGFTFPWFGSNKTGLIATTDGWLTFNMNYTGSNYSNAELGPSSGNSDLQLAPLWDDGERDSNTQFRYELRQTPEGKRFLVVMWKGIGFYAAGTGIDGNLNYEVVLWESGEFDFRYGPMTSGTQSRTNGGSATIGFQNPDRTINHNFSHNTEVPGGLANRSWRYRPRIGGSDQLVVRPTDSTTYTLCVTNQSTYEDCQELRIVVVQPGDLLFSEAMIAPASPDAEWFEVRNLSPDPIDLSIGSWSITAGTGETFALPGTAPIIPPDGYLVFARSGVAGDNGGLVPDVVYGSALTLDDAADALEIRMGSLVVDRFAWDAAWTIPTDQSIAAEPSVLAPHPSTNDSPSAWCPSTAPYGNGTFTGSPGAAGAGCAPPAP
jgi:hypothetical protein